MEQKTVDYYNDAAMNTAVCQTLFYVLCICVNSWVFPSRLIMLSLFCREGGDGDTKRLSSLLRVIELIPKRQSQDLNPGRLAPEPRL